MKVEIANDPAKAMQDKLEHAYNSLGKARMELHRAQAATRGAEWEMVNAAIEAGLTDCLRVNVSMYARMIGK